jgi:creatinine amidohydrolase
MADVREMESMTVKEVRAALRETQAVIVPIGCVEQHGYHLPLCTDVITAQAASREAARRTGAFLAPPVYYSFSGGELPGTVNVNPEVTSLYLREIGAGLRAMGFRQIAFVSGHCGTEHMAAVKGACEALTRSYDDVAVAWVPLFEASAMWVAAAKEGDFHSGWVETSMIDHAAPESVRPEIALDSADLAERMRKDPDAYLVSRTVSRNRLETPHRRQDPRIEVGVMGYPERHSAGFGATVIAEAAETIAGVVNDLVNGMRPS